MDSYINFLNRDDRLYNVCGMDALNFLDMGVARMLELVSVVNVRVDTVLLKGGLYTERLLNYWFLSPSIALSFCIEMDCKEHYFFADKLPDGSIILNNELYVSFNDLLDFSSCDSFSALFHYDREVE